MSLQQAIASEPSDEKREILIATQNAQLMGEINQYQVTQILIALKNPGPLSDCENDCPACEYGDH